MKKILLISFMLLFTIVSSSWAQDRTVSGKVTEAENGEGTPGVNIILKGTTTGTTSDIDGNYKLNVPTDGGTLVFSFIGMATQEVEIGARSVIDVSMAADATELSEVVVTALGTRQNAREVTYANQTVGAEDLLTTTNKNALEALRGKTAGVQLTTASGSVGASTRITLRGAASITGNNTALIVVDGVPIDNTSSLQGNGQANTAGGGEGGYADYGNRFNDFDPNNIESVTILKGPSATSLYGSRGASGVVLITTKSGSKDGKIRVNFNSTSSIEKAYVLLERQDQYGQGLINPDGSNNVFSGENFSWGQPVDGIVRPWTSPVDTDGDGTLEFLSRPYSAVPNQLDNFFQLGRTYTNSLSVSGGNELFTYYVSYGNTDQKGILENTDYLRHSVAVNTSAKLSNKLSATLGVNYANVDVNTAFEGSRAFEGNNPYASAVQAAVTIPYTELRDYTSPFHDFGGYYGSFTVNPYFILNEYTNNAKTDNVVTNLSLTYNPIENLTLSTRIGMNYVSLERTTITPQYQYLDHLVWQDDNALVPFTGRQGNAGAVSTLNRTSRTIDWTSTASYTTNIQEGIRLTTTVGMNYFDTRIRNIFGDTNGGLVVPEVYNLANSALVPSVTQLHSARRIIGLFGNVNLGFNERIFVDLSARSDWSSTLPRDNQSFAYWSIGANAILSEFTDMSGAGIDYFKLRASYGTTGKDAGVQLLSSTFNINPTLVDYGDVYQVNAPITTANGAITGISRGNLIGNNALKPELTTTFDIGADVNFFNGRIELVYNYYISNHTEQIVRSELARSSGYRNIAVNVGEIENKGHEITLGLTPLNLQNGFRWKMNVTWSKNTNLVKKVSDQADQLVIWDSGRGVVLSAQEGQPFGTWRGQVPTFTDAGEQIVDANGSPVYSADPEAVASIQPDWIGGVVNTFSFKGFTLGAVLDRKKGGSFFSLTKSAVEFNGTGLTTLIGDRLPFVVPNSVQEVLDGDGNPTGTYAENTQTILADAFVFDGNYTKHVLDGSYLKLREVTLGYDLPKSIVSKMKLQGLNVRLFAKNLMVWQADENVYADAESAFGGPGTTQSNIQGIESTQTPNSRSYGFSINANF